MSTLAKVLDLAAGGASVGTKNPSASNTGKKGSSRKALASALRSFKEAESDDDLLEAFDSIQDLSKPEKD